MRMDKSENVFKNENKTPYLVHNFDFALIKFTSKINVKNESQESNRASRASNSKKKKIYQAESDFFFLLLNQNNHLNEKIESVQFKKKLLNQFDYKIMRSLIKNY